MRVWPWPVADDEPPEPHQIQRTYSPGVGIHRPLWTANTPASGFRNTYFPQHSLREDYFKSSDTTTVSPWKGTAHYLTVTVDGHSNPDAAWTCPTLYSAAEEISGTASRSGTARRCAKPVERPYARRRAYGEPGAATASDATVPRSTDPVPRLPSSPQRDAVRGDTRCRLRGQLAALHESAPPGAQPCSLATTRGSFPAVIGVRRHLHPPCWQASRRSGVRNR